MPATTGAAMGMTRSRKKDEARLNHADKKTQRAPSLGGVVMTQNGALYRLLAWLSPAFPVGAYSYSHGLEYAVEAGLVDDRATLTAWVEAILRHGAGRVDASVFCESYAAVRDGDGGRLRDVAARAGAMRGTAETALESQAQGAAFLVAVLDAWPTPAITGWRERLGDEAPVYAVAVAMAAATHGVPLDSALAAFLQGFVGNLISAGLRLIPLGQTDGQIALAALEPAVADAAAAAQARPFADIGTATPMVDWTSMQHETQYTRLFRS